MLSRRVAPASRQPAGRWTGGPDQPWPAIPAGLARVHRAAGDHPRLALAVPSLGGPHRPAARQPVRAAGARARPDLRDREQRRRVLLLVVGPARHRRAGHASIIAAGPVDAASHDLLSVTGRAPIRLPGGRPGGALDQVRIAGQLSGISIPASVYLPAAYFARGSRRDYPVLAVISDAAPGGGSPYAAGRLAQQRGHRDRGRPDGPAGHRHAPGDRGPGGPGLPEPAADVRAPGAAAARRSRRRRSSLRTSRLRSSPRSGSAPARRTGPCSVTRPAVTARCSSRWTTPPCSRSR